MTSQGTTRAQLDRLRSEIIQSLALLEALIDFGEGEDIEEGLYEQGNFLPFLSVSALKFPTVLAREQVLSLHRTIQSLLSDRRRGEILRSGIRLAIFGPPNAGKSSL